MVYKLTLKDKIYFLFVNDNIKRFSYLHPKVEKHIKNYFRKVGISFLYDFNKYTISQTKNIIWEYENK